MNTTKLDMIRKALSNVKEKKIFPVNEDHEMEIENKKKKEESYKKMETLFDYLNEMYTCKKCGKNCRLFGKKIDDKVILRTHMCFDCLIEYETNLRIIGKYDEYEKRKVEENAKSWLYDFKQSLVEYKNQYSDEIKSYVTQDGDIEEWGGGESKEKISELLDKLYEEVEKQILGITNINKDEKSDEK